MVSALTKARPHYITPHYWQWKQGRDGIEARVGFALGDRQHEALRTVATSKVSVLTGEPGVGKATVVDAIGCVLAAKGLRIVQAAPTGRAGGG